MGAIWHHCLFASAVSRDCFGWVHAALARHCSSAEGIVAKHGLACPALHVPRWAAPLAASWESVISSMIGWVEGFVPMALSCRNTGMSLQCSRLLPTMGLLASLCWPVHGGNRGVLRKRAACCTAKILCLGVYLSGSAKLDVSVLEPCCWREKARQRWALGCLLLPQWMQWPEAPPARLQLGLQASAWCCSHVLAVSVCLCVLLVCCAWDNAKQSSTRVPLDAHTLRTLPCCKSTPSYTCSVAASTSASGWSCFFAWQ